MLPGRPDHLEIPRGLKRALDHIRSNTYRRGKRYWETPSAPDITQDTVTKLRLKNLVTIHHGRGRDRVDLTDLGKHVVEMVAAAREKRQ